MPCLDLDCFNQIIRFYITFFKQNSSDRELLSRILICLDGTGMVRSEQGDARAHTGDVILVPADGAAASLENEADQRLLRVDIPAQVGTLLA